MYCYYAENIKRPLDCIEEQINEDEEAIYFLENAENLCERGRYLTSLGSAIDLQETTGTFTDNEFHSIEWTMDEDSILKPHSSVEFKWEIKNFSALPKGIDTFYESPKYNSSGFSWRLRLYPNGISRCTCTSEDWMGLYLEMCSGHQRNIIIYCVVGIENINGTKDFLKGLNSVHFRRTDVKGWKKFLEVDELARRKSEFYPSDTLTFSIWIRHDIPESLRRKYCSHFNL